MNTYCYSHIPFPSANNTTKFQKKKLKHLTLIQTTLDSNFQDELQK